MFFDLFHVLTEHAAVRPDQCAIDDGRLQISYGELISRIDAAVEPLNQHHRTDREQSVIALAMPASTQAAVYALAILRSGNIWLQVNPDDAPDVLTKILLRSKCKVVVTHPAQVSRLEQLTDAGVVGVVVDSLPAQTLSPHRAGTFNPQAAADLYYTSGSTGLPKGVWKSHASTIASGLTRVRTGSFTPDDRVAIFGDWGYSYVRNTFYASLLAGARMVVPRGRYRNFQGVDQWLVDNAISVTAMIPSAAKTVASTSTVTPTTLRQIVLGGEPTTKQDIDTLKKFLPIDCEIHNQFGAAEAGYIGFTDYTKSVDDTKLRQFRLLEGHTIDVIDADDAGIGVMKVTGPNISNGYWCDDALTAARFSGPNSSDGNMSFLSDDLVRDLGDNRFERAGRVDDRVKIRGFNVYLKEVEASLLTIADVEEACVLVDPRRDNKSLTGFVSSASKVLTGTSIRNLLRDDLPVQHIPRQVIVLESLPRTARGKIDRQALASLSMVKKASKNMPSTDLERALAEIWKSVLDLNEVDVLEDFMMLGGDSLLAVELVSRVKNTFAVEDTGALLQHGNTIRSMARTIVSGGGNDRPLVVLRGDGSGQPFVMVHGSGGELYNLTSLSSLLPKTRPVYAFRRTNTKFISVDRLAECYVQELRQQQPKGPYVIAGYSFGGTVAVQMGAKLLEQGETVSLIMLDVSLKPSLLFCRLIRQLVLKKAAGDFVVSGSAQFHWLRRYKSAVWRFYHWQILGLVRHIRYRMSDDDMSGQIRSNRNQALSSLSGIAHTITEYHGEVAVFRAEQYHRARPWDLGWSQMIPRDKLKVVNVPGSHSTILQQPDVLTLAEKVNEVIAAFDSKVQGAEKSNWSTQRRSGGKG